MQLGERHRKHWHWNLALTALLLALWFAVTFVAGWYARDLQDITVLGFPLPYYLGAQGAPLIYLLINGGYAWLMSRLDRKYGVAEEDE